MPSAGGFALVESEMGFLPEMVLDHSALSLDWMICSSLAPASDIIEGHAGGCGNLRRRLGGRRDRDTPARLDYVERLGGDRTGCADGSWRLTVRQRSLRVWRHRAGSRLW